VRGGTTSAHDAPDEHHEREQAVAVDRLERRGDPEEAAQGADPEPEGARDREVVE
jgi:hypothetical protein